jgi:acyl-CoA thioesterase-1
MIIMRRIILACVAAALTACNADRPDADAGMPPQRTTAPVLDDSATAGDSATPRSAERSVVLFVGTSLTAGYGVGPELSYPSVIQQLIDSAGLPFTVVNAGISGETSAGGLRRIDWSLQQPAVALVLELGANDALRGLDPGAMYDNLDAILTRARTVNPDIAIVIAGMEAPPNLGGDYASRFRDVFSRLAREHDAGLVPFLLDGVAADPALNLDDGIHPNAAGHRILARNVWAVLDDVLVNLARQSRPITDSP